MVREIVRRVVFCFALLLSLTSMAQKSAEIEKAEHFLSQGKEAYLTHGRLDSIRPYAEKAVKIARKLDEKILLMRALIALGNGHMEDTTGNQCTVYWKEASDIAQAFKKDSVRADIQQRFGVYYLNRNDLEVAIPYFLDAIKLYGKSGHESLSGQSYLALVQVYASMGDEIMRKKYLYKAVKLNEKSTDLTKKSIVQSIAASHYANISINDSAYVDTAIQLAKDAIQTARQIDFFSRMGSAYSTLSELYFKKDQLNLAMVYSDSVLLMKDHLASGSLGFHYYRMARIQLGLNNEDQAIIFLDSAEKYAQSVNQHLIMPIFHEKYRAFKAMGDYLSALEQLELVQDMKDSLTSIERYNGIQEIEKKYQSELHLSQIRELEQKSISDEKEKEIQKLKIARQYGLIVGLILGGLLLIFTIWWYFRRKKLLKDKLMAETKQKLLRSQMNPHFLYNSLAAVQRSILKDDNKKQAAIHLGDFSSLMRKVLESTFSELVSIEDELKLLSEYLSIQQFRLDGMIDYSVDLDPEIDPIRQLIPPMILQPFIENSIEHGRKPDMILTIHIKLRQDNERIIIELIDNGLGMGDVPKMYSDHTSRAISVVQERLLLLQETYKTPTSLEIINRNDNGETGVHVEICLPVLLV